MEKFKTPKEMTNLELVDAAKLVKKQFNQFDELSINNYWSVSEEFDNRGIDMEWLLTK